MLLVIIAHMPERSKGSHSRCDEAILVSSNLTVCNLFFFIQNLINIFHRFILILIIHQTQISKTSQVQPLQSLLSRQSAVSLSISFATKNFSKINPFYLKLKNWRLAFS